jgi:hypothetical protein
MREYPPGGGPEPSWCAPFPGGFSEECPVTDLRGPSEFA